MIDSEIEKRRKSVFANETLRLLRENEFDIIGYNEIKPNYLDADAKLKDKSTFIGIICQVKISDRGPYIEMDLLVSNDGNKSEKYFIGGEKDELYEPLNGILRLFMDKQGDVNSLLNIEAFFRKI